MSFHFDNKPSIITQPATLLLSSNFVQTMFREYYEKVKAITEGTANTHSYSSAQEASLPHKTTLGFVLGNPRWLLLISFFLLDVYKQFSRLFHCFSEKLNSPIQFPNSSFWGGEDTFPGNGN